MTTQIKSSYRLLISVFLVLVGGALLIGCGGASHPATDATAKPASKTTGPIEAKHPLRPAPEGDLSSPKNSAISEHNKASCERAVQSAPSLTDAAKSEIGALCFRMNYIKEDNEKTVRSICEEVANASSLTNEAARKRTITGCYLAGMR
jgi:hypothetical protein